MAFQVGLGTLFAFLSLLGTLAGLPPRRDDIDMKKVTLILSLISGIFSGLLWTIAQTGGAGVNEHLCQFAGKFLQGEYAEPIPNDCPATDILLGLAGWFFWLFVALLFVTVCWEAYSRLSEYEKRKQLSRALKSSAEDGPERHFSEAKGELHPDLRLKNLFFYVNPDCFGGAGENTIRTGDDILDKLSTGKVVAWGRANNEGIQKPLTQIPREYWGNATFDYAFFCDDTCVQAEPLPGYFGPSYSDLQFNRERVKAVWPKAPRKGASFKDRWLSMWQRVCALIFTRPRH